MIPGSVEIKHFLIAGEGRFVLDVLRPADLEGVQQPPWGDRCTKEPREELIHGTARQAPRGFPFPPAGPCGVEWVSTRGLGIVLFRAGFAEVERDDSSDARIECGGDSGGIAAARHGAKHDGPPRIDLGAFQQESEAARQVPEPPLAEALAGESERIAE